MRGCFAVVFLSLSALGTGRMAADASVGELVLAEKGQSAYRIVLADTASPSTRHAAQELQEFLSQMTG